MDILQIVLIFDTVPIDVDIPHPTMTNLQDLLGTTKCSFLDFRNEIESARKDPGRRGSDMGS